MVAIDRLFERLALTYGSAWQNSFGAAPITDVKSMWQHELSSFMQNKETMKRIVWALDNLPERVPNVIQFKNLCRMAPAPEVPMLPAPPADPARVAAELAKLAPMMVERTERVDPKAWAKRLRFRNLAGERLNSIQIQMYKQALKEEA
jgi:hypothetical protein